MLQRQTLGSQGIYLVVNQHLLDAIGPDFVQHLLHVGDLLEVGRVGAIHHVQQQIGFAGLLQGGGKGIDQRVRQVADEAHGVGQRQAAPGLAQVELARGGVERGKELVGGVGARLDQRVEERRFAGVGVAHQRDLEGAAAVALVKARAYAADQLFATLDTTTRQLYLSEAGRSLSLSDTVGFIRDLPHALVNAFAATLQEACEADLLLHVVDCANPAHLEQIANVQQVLHEIGADGIEQVLVYNKIDALAPERLPQQSVDLMELDGLSVARIFLSAQTGQGLDALRGLLAQRLQAVLPAAAAQEMV